MTSSFIARASSPVSVTAAENATKALLLTLFPDIGKETSGDQVYWQVSEYQGKLTASFDYTFRRSTRTAAFRQNSSRILAANKRLEYIASMFKHQVSSLRLCTLDQCKRSDDNAESNGDSAYSEYEQSIGGEVVLKA